MNKASKGLCVTVTPRGSVERENKFKPTVCKPSREISVECEWNRLHLTLGAF